MDQKIDDASYNEGKAAFAAGASLRSIVEQIMAIDGAPDAKQRKATELRSMSGALGFADALLDQLRRPPVIVAGPLTEEEMAEMRNHGR